MLGDDSTLLEPRILSIFVVIDVILPEGGTVHQKVASLKSCPTLKRGLFSEYLFYCEITKNAIIQKLPHQAP